MNALRTLLIASALSSGASLAAPYTVKAGDTLYSVAQKYGMEPVQVMQLNGLPSPTLQVGQTLEVGGVEEAPQRPVSAARPASPAARPVAAKPAPEPRVPQAKVTQPKVAAAPQVAPARGGSAFVRTAATRFLGIRYALGGTGSGLDCSGFTLRVFQQMGVRLPRTAAAQWRMGVGVSRRDLRAGDLVFFNTTGRAASHVGIYIGDGLMANANSFRGRTVIEPLFANAYWASRYIGARRVLS